MDDIRINDDRLYDSLDELGRVGAFDDEFSDRQGVCRLALSDEDAEGRRLVRSWYEEAGLAVGVDQIGNVFATRKGTGENLRPVMTGSHIDSVPTGGRFDGALGVLAGLEVVRTLNDAGMQTLRPITTAFFSDEEGCRFRTDMLGSAVATGRVALEHAWSLTDRDGKTVREELERIGFLGDEPVGERTPHAFVECHIEQGPLLIRDGQDLGVVTGVQGISWWEVSITGRSAHAGTTPTSFRNDAGLVAALINVRLREMADSGDFGEMRGTMGVTRPHPGAINVIPGRVAATVDLRNPDDAQMARADEAIREHALVLAELHGVQIEWQQTAKTAMVSFDESVQDRIEGIASDFGLQNTRLIAGAGHDAQEWAAVCKAGMIFVPGEDDGISHNPREFSTKKQCTDGVNVLLHAILALADES
jgi:N-carbamoyl-L-amino-acid hydrolase